MFNNKRAIICFIFAFAGGVLSGQSVPKGVSAAPVFSTVPFWPSTGTPPSEFASRFFVYWNVAEGEYVVSYPQQLTTGLPDDGRRIEFRFESQALVEPAISVLVARDAGGALTYDYTVANQANARRPIRKLSLVTSSEDTALMMGHPTWRLNKATLPDQNPAQEGPQFKIQAHVGRLISWASNSDAESIGATTARGGFRVKSRFLPGITVAYSSSEAPPVLPANIPVQVKEQIDLVLKPETFWKPSITIGPKFNPDSGPSKDPIWIASDYRLAVERLRVEGNLPSDRFTEELVGILDQIAANGQRAPIEFRNSPGTTLQSQIVKAVVIALSSE